MFGVNDVSCVALSHKFRGIRVYEDSLCAVNFRLKLFCGPSRECAPTIQQAGHLSAISYQVLLYWIENILDDVVFLDPTTELGHSIYYSVDNKIFHTPGQPDDFLLARLLHSKMRAITHGNVEVGSMMLSSSDTGHTERWWTSNEYALPDLTYLGDGKPVHPTPWWERPTIDTMDVLEEELEEEELKNLRELADPLAEYEKALLEEEAAEAEIIDNLWNK